MEYNIYCDESCYLENDKQNRMVLGGIWCSKTKVYEIVLRIKEIKFKHKLPKTYEIKWTKVSPAKLDFYLDLVDYFFDENSINFRSIVIDKTKLNHNRFNQTHDDFYYKMYFQLLKLIITPSDEYFIYLDIKDTKSAVKTKKLHDVLTNNIYDFHCKIIKRIQLVHSHEVNLLQLADLLIGAVCYVNRNLTSSKAKTKIIQRIQERSKYSLTKSTLPTEKKFNIFLWNGNDEF